MPIIYGDSYSGSAFELAVRNPGYHEVDVHATGDLDLAAAVHLKRLLFMQCEAGYSVINLDISGVTFLDCSCIGAIIGAHRQCAAKHCTLVLRGATPATHRLLGVLGVDQVLLRGAIDFAGSRDHRDGPGTAGLEPSVGGAAKE